MIIYGNHFSIYKDPGILALNPIKLILVNANIADSMEAGSLAQCMIKKDDWQNKVNPWRSGVIAVDVRSVDKALKDTLEINTETNKPYRTVYSAGEELPTRV